MADLTLEDLNAYQAEADKYDRPIAAAALGAARGASFGLSDLALTQSGLVSPETISKIEEASPTISTLSNITGVIAPALLSGGTVYLLQELVELVRVLGQQVLWEEPQRQRYLKDL